MLAIIFLTVGVASRVIFHAPNFTPVIALVFFGGMFLNKKYSWWLPLILMAASDLILGLHSVIAFTWGALLVISLLGRRWYEKRDAVHVLGGGMASAVIFFLITNFGAWLTMYPHTWQGLARCYWLAIPFFRNTLASTFVYTGVLYGLYQLVSYRVRSTRFAWLAA
ncbi:MAG: DUF6580 family putative transport protein [Candidatus Omnitrophota bacterium]